ncbi:hypothetical protein [Reichenbachiella versicolor]|uniref:hypothetical protein n=1 Tax=Reichenbachiella versicolor TaxID=1821036 RepID=UPI000D6DE3E8|nr:hypothetical protein [Reichenbachiella versicolor]
MNTIGSPSEIIDFNNLKVYCFHYKDCKNQEQMINKYNAQLDYLKQNPKMKYLLFDYTGASIGTTYMSVAKSNSAFWDSKEVALLGVEGLKKILLKGYNAVARIKILSFDSKEEALDSLIQRSNQLI